MPVISGHLNKHFFIHHVMLYALLNIQKSNISLDYFVKLYFPLRHT